MMNWAKIKKRLLLTNNCIYLNSGGLGPNPEAVLDVQLNFLRKRNTGNGPSSSILQENLKRKILNIREKIAAFLGLQSDLGEIIFTPNTTEAIRFVLDAINFSSNDEILTTDLEHDTALYNCVITHQKFGVHIKKISLYDNHRNLEAIPKLIRKQITPNTRLLLISHISYSTGIRLPVEEIIKTCKASFPNLLILIDGAHATGQINVDLRKINCDFYATDAHKWLLGPEGIGLLYARKKFLEANNPNKINFHFLRGLSVNPNYEPNATTFNALLNSQNVSFSHIVNSQRALELGTVNRSDILGLGAAIEFINNIGIDNIEKRIFYLTNILREKLRNLPQIKIISPDNKNLCSGIVSFQIKDFDSYNKLKDLTKKLEHDYNIICRAIPYPKCIRTCVHFFTNERDIDTFLKVISQIT